MGIVFPSLVQAKNNYLRDTQLLGTISVLLYSRVVLNAKNKI